MVGLPRRASPALGKARPRASGFSLPAMDENQDGRHSANKQLRDGPLLPITNSSLTPSSNRCYTSYEERRSYVIVPRQQITQRIREDQAVAAMRNLPESFYLGLATIAAAMDLNVEDITTMVIMMGDVWLRKHIGLDRIQ